MNLKSRLLQENEYNGFPPNNETIGSKIKNGLKNNWGKLLGGAAAGAGAYMLADHFSDDVHDFDKNMHEVAEKGTGNYWNTGIEKISKALNGLQVNTENSPDHSGTTTENPPVNANEPNSNEKSMPTTTPKISPHESIKNISNIASNSNSDYNAQNNSKFQERYA